MTSTETTKPVAFIQAFHFHTMIDGEKKGPFQIMGTSVQDAVADLRRGLYDGETIVGWA